jgi:serine/threonine protein kinase
MNYVAHYDLKLGNILVKGNEIRISFFFFFFLIFLFLLFLADYGEARQLLRTLSKQNISNVGTYMFMAPEMVNEDLF